MLGNVTFDQADFAFVASGAPTASRCAESVAATLASPDRSQDFSLSPASLQGLPGGYRLVLPSPNGAALAYSASHRSVLAACLRNAAAAAFEQFRGELSHAIRASGSGQELMERGSGEDIELAAELDVRANVPRLVNRMFGSFG